MMRCNQNSLTDFKSGVHAVYHDRQHHHANEAETSNRQNVQRRNERKPYKSFNQLCKDFS